MPRTPFEFRSVPNPIGSLLASAVAALVVFTPPETALAAARGDVSHGVEAGLAASGLSLGAWAIGRRIAGPSLRPRRSLAITAPFDARCRVAGALLAAGLATGCSGADASAPPPPAGLHPNDALAGASGVGPGHDAIVLPPRSLAYVRVERAEHEPEDASVRAPVRVVFRDAALSEVGAPVPGKVTKIHVEVGQRVDAGTPLVTLSSPAASSLRLKLERAQIDRDIAASALRRHEQMMTQGIGREADRVAAANDLAEADVALKHARRAVAMLGRSAGGTVTVDAPIAGTVLRRHTTVGAQVLASGAPLLELGDPDALWAVAEVFQDDLPAVAADSPVTLEFAARTEPVAGRVAHVGALVDAGLRRAPVYITLPEGIAGLTPGMYGRASIPSHDARGVVLPKTAVLIEDGQHSVAYVETAPGAFVQRPVVLGHTFGDRVQVLSGVESGERVATAGALLLDQAARKQDGS
jgi:cobalt-zinc-cadmium efflux system membrane fusion protein